MMALLFLIVLSLLGLSAMELGIMQNKMQQNLATKNISLQRAESAVAVAEQGLSRGEKIAQQNEQWSYIITAKNLFPDKQAYEITATGIAGTSKTILQVIDVLESPPHIYRRLLWNEIGA